MKILVTGGGGFLGNAICRDLRRAGYDVRSFQRSFAPRLSAHEVEIYSGDIRDKAAITKAAQGCGAVIHTAAKAGVWGSARDYFQTNVSGTENVLAACRESGIGYLVHTSTPSVVHTGVDIAGGDESLPIADHFAAPYPASKAEAEAMVLGANCPALKTVALRPHLIWGPNDPHLLPRLIKRAKSGRISLPAADKLIDTVYVDNASSAHLTALEALRSGRDCAGKPYFITNGQPLMQGDIIIRLLRAAGLDNVQIRRLSPRVARTIGAVLETVWTVLRLSSEPALTRFSAEQLSTAHWFDCSAAHRDLNWKPQLSIEQGLDMLKQSTALPDLIRDG